LKLLDRSEKGGQRKKLDFTRSHIPKQLKRSSKYAKLMTLNSEDSSDEGDNMKFKTGQKSKSPGIYKVNKNFGSQPCTPSFSKRSEDSLSQKSQKAWKKSHIIQHLRSCDSQSWGALSEPNDSHQDDPLNPFKSRFIWKNFTWRLNNPLMIGGWMKACMWTFLKLKQLWGSLKRWKKT